MVSHSVSKRPSPTEPPPPAAPTTSELPKSANPAADIVWQPAVSIADLEAMMAPPAPQPSPSAPRPGTLSAAGPLQPHMQAIFERAMPHMRRRITELREQAEAKLDAQVALNSKTAELDDLAFDHPARIALRKEIRASKNAYLATTDEEDSLTQALAAWAEVWGCNEPPPMQSEIEALDKKMADILATMKAELADL